MVVNEYSLGPDLIEDLVQSVPESSLVDRSEPAGSVSGEGAGAGAVAVAVAKNDRIQSESNSGCSKRLQMSARSDVTVIPLCGRAPKCEPRDSEEKLKNSGLTILPVTNSGSSVTKQTSDAVKTNGLVPKTRNSCVEFSLTPAVTIETVVSDDSSNSKAQKVNDVVTYQHSNFTESSISRDQFGRCFSANKSPTCPTPSQSSCLYSKPISAFPATCSKSCAVLPASSASNALVPINQCNQNGSYCGFNSFTPSPLSSPKHVKPINALNSCRMSSSPVPAYMRSREPSYSAPLLCNIISESFSGLMPPDSSSSSSSSSSSCSSSSSSSSCSSVSSYKSANWNTPPFRSPTASTSFNFPLPPNGTHSTMNAPAFPSCNQSSLIIPVNHGQKSSNCGNSCRAGFPPSFSPNGFQRAQCCFSSQIQCFNGGCSTGSQQQFSIVQHSTRLSNLKTNSMDSVSSLLQYHYFKKY